MVKRVLAGSFGALLFGLLVPLLTVLFLGAPSTALGFVWLVLAGLGIGAVLGMLFPRVFGFVFETFLELGS